MSYFIFNQAKNVDIFAHTRLIEKIGDIRRIAGLSYLETKDFLPATMKLLFERDIQRAISDNKLPKMMFTIATDTGTPVTLYSIIIHHIAEPIVFRPAAASEPDIYCEESNQGRIELTELAHYVRAKIMQILWCYNADLITPRSIYGQTRFIYQIALSPLLIERQIRSFDIKQRSLERPKSPDFMTTNVAKAA